MGASRLEITAPVRGPHNQILTADALRFLASLAENFEGRRQDLLARRRVRQAQIDKGIFPDFLTETADVRAKEWTVAPSPADLLDRRVEITGPVDRKMIINALNCGANVFMADFEDANSPAWQNNLDGQINLRDAVNRTIEFKSPEGKAYKLNDKTATLLVRPRHWQTVEKHVLLNGQPVSGSLFDFGLYFFHNAKNLMQRATGPYFYLPKLESHLEARLWNDVFNFSQDALGIPRGTIRATVLIETILAAFEMDEILWEMRDHSSGLNCGRWDYMFSFIKKFRNHPEFVLPNRAEVTMERHFLQSYVELLIQTCHRRNIHAMGGMAAQVPIKNDPAANQQALDKVRADKLREVKAGHDGTWVAHPGLVAIAKEVFDEYMKTPNQISMKHPPVQVTAKDLLAAPAGTITEAGLRWNIDVGLQYVEAWLRGVGCVPIYNLMEDAATAEICRAQVWQWVKHGAKLDDGRPVTAELARLVTVEQLEKLKTQSPGGRFDEAGKIFEQMTTSAEFSEFLTQPAYEYID
ncbi:MAG: malate synthase A [Bryobacterales bacterium]|nr:malate synthase A [Bryobacterales bacterium]MBV9398479.1 malate synthase A [Bryobacterales bacterium]